MIPLTKAPSLWGCNLKTALHNFRPQPILVLGILLILGLSSCKKEELKLGQRGDLIEIEHIKDLSKGEVIEAIDEFSAANYALYDVALYRVTYRSIFNKKAIDTRGLLVVPRGVSNTDLMLFCHGTHLPSKLLGANKQTPSTYEGEKKNHQEARNIGLIFASQGYSIFLPDYIGYGITLNKEHPYLLLKEQYLSNIDGMLACKKALQNLNYTFDNDLFIAGWSQGAACSLSAHRFTQEQYPTEFNVIASSGYAGPYDFMSFAETLLAKPDEEVDVIQLFCWYAYVANKYSDLQRPSDQIYQYNVYDQFSAILTPSKKPSVAFRPYFLAGIKDKSDTPMIEFLEENSFHANWKPQGKVFMHHGKKDQLVPYINSVSAYNGLTAAGGDIQFYSYEEADHFSALGTFITRTISDFNSLK